MQDEAGRALAWALLLAARSSGRLAQLMKLYAFRKALGAPGRRAAWIALGARLADTVVIGPRVTMRVPRHVSVGAGSSLTGRIWIDSWGEVTIGRNVLMNGDIDLFTAQHLLDSPTLEGEIRTIQIDDYAWLPHWILVLPGVRIGSHAVIGSGSVVTGDVPDYAVAAGNPARVVKQRARVPYVYVPSDLTNQGHRRRVADGFTARPSDRPLDILDYRPPREASRVDAAVIPGGVSGPAAVAAGRGHRRTPPSPGTPSSPA